MLGRITLLLLCVLTISALGAGEDLRSPEVSKLRSEVRANLSLKGADGRMHAPLADRGQKATVLVFVMHDCPVTNSTAPELVRLVKEFSGRGVEFFRIYITEDAAEIDTHGKEFGLEFRGLLDPKLDLARAVGATRAPEAVVLSPDGTLLYRGRIDDRAVKLGVTRPIARQRDLQLALEAVLAGQKPERRFTTAIGCYLPSK